jgi:tetratricopeptide (TPR) repeat protein
MDSAGKSVGRSFWYVALICVAALFIWGIVHLENEGYFDPQDEAERTQQAREYLGSGAQKLMAKNFDGAIADFSRTIRLMPNQWEAYWLRSMAYMIQKDYDKAHQDCLRAIEIKPDEFNSMNTLAWIMATCPDEKLRNGAQAVEYATKSCDLTDWKKGMIIDTLAAACAESGDFQKAILWQKRAIELGIDDPEEAKKMPDRLKLYQEGKPFRSD